MVVMTGNAHRALAESVCEHLRLPLGKLLVDRFSDGEIMVEVLENVRSRDVFVVQPTCAPTNDNLMELLIIMDALRRASAGTITAVIPYMGYARQDRRPRSARVPISAKLVARMVQSAGAHRVLTVDLHADQIQGFYDIPVDNLYSSAVLLGDIYRRKAGSGAGLMVVSPDVGGVVRARAVTKRIEGADLAIIDKRRSRPNEAQVMNLIGDVSGRSCIIIDDMVDTAGTLCEAARVLKDRGAVHVAAYCTHPVLSGRAVANVEGSTLDELVVTDTIPLRPDAAACSRIRQVSVSGLLAECMRRVDEGESLSTLFVD
ncbi:MAG TPA: ribose-phosphate pyrophosphokinase [Gammaproteobacteria bacterium]|nr:ribose-phosphate pyrophosphokinase [Gammaproteobacteria bacterium]